MAYLWNYVYYNETLAVPIWQKELSETANPLTPYQPLVIDEGDYRGVYFCVVTNDGDLYFWKWDWEIQLLFEWVFPRWNNYMRAPTLTRTLSFVSGDCRRAFIVTNGHGAGIQGSSFAEVTPAISSGLPPVYLGAIQTTPRNEEPTVAYAGDATFACIVDTTLNARILSWDNDFPTFTLPRQRAPFQHGSKLTRPLILFTRTTQGGITPEAPPTIVHADGTTKSTADFSLPPAMATGQFTVGLSPQHSGYDHFFWNLPTNWNLTTQINVYALDWVRDETAWIYIKGATLPKVETPPEISVLGSACMMKHISAVNLGALVATEAFSISSGYNYTYYLKQDALFFADLASPETHLCIFTPIGTVYSLSESSQSLGFATISPATFHFERGCWYSLVTYKSKLAIFQIVHPQFFSRYFASVPAISAVSTDERHATFIGKVTPRYPRQHWEFVVVAMKDSKMRESIASTKNRVTDWEVWEVSDDGLNWVTLPAGAPVEGRRWVRVRIPKSILEWKKDTFEGKYPNEKWRLAFISEPVI